MNVERPAAVQPGAGQPGLEQPGAGQPGLERQVPPLEPVSAAVATWRAIAASHAAVCAALEDELGERHGLGVSEFEVLERLTESEDHKFRAQELADAVYLSQSALSRLISRLERHGLVERSLCDMDRRGIYVVLTDAGRRRHAEAVRTHRDVLARLLPAGMLSG